MTPWLGRDLSLEQLLYLGEAFPPVVRATLGVSDGQNDNLLPPDRVGNVVLTKTRLQVHPAHTSATDVVEKRIGTDVVTCLKVTELEGSGDVRINAGEILNAIVVLLLRRRMKCSRSSWTQGRALNAQTGEERLGASFRFLGAEQLYPAFLYVLHAGVDFSVPCSLDLGVLLGTF